MVVDSMTLEEIAQELNNDFSEAERISFYRHPQFKSLVLKTRSFPIRRHYECTPPKRKNRFFVLFSAFKRSHHKNPFTHYYCIFSRPEGLFCAIVGLDCEDRVYLYPPHFFARYRERIIKRDDLSPEELIHFFMNRFWGVCGAFEDAEYAEDLSKWDQLTEEGPIDFVGTCPDGATFGTKHGNVIIIKTIVPESMLYPDQVPFYEKVYLTNWREMNRVLPEEMVDYISSSEFDYYQPPAPATQEAIDKLRQKYRK